MLDTPTPLTLTRATRPAEAGDLIALDLFPGQWLRDDCWGRWDVPCTHGGHVARVTHMAVEPTDLDTTGPAVRVTFFRAARHTSQTITETEVFGWDERFTLA